jgi:hypothetical protein
MYNPPTVKNYPHIHPAAVRDYKDAYDVGYNDSSQGLTYIEPFESSKHERDTTYGDELNFQYYAGYYDYERV